MKSFSTQKTTKQGILIALATMLSLFAPVFLHAQLQRMNAPSLGSLYDIKGANGVFIGNSFLTTELFRSTDHGQTWRPLREFFAFENDLATVDFHGDTVLCSIDLLSDSVTRNPSISYDGGETWGLIPGPQGQGIAAFTGINLSNNRIHVWNEDTLFISDDMGQHWDAHQSPNVGYLRQVVENADHLFVLTNMGLYWSPTNTYSLTPLYTFANSYSQLVVKGDTVVLFHSINTLRVSTDGGLTFQQYNTFIYPFSLKFIGGTLYSIQQGQIYTSTDLGATWTMVNDPIQGSFTCIAWDGQAFALGNNDEYGVAVTLDNFQTWNVYNEGISDVELYGVYFTGDSIYCAVRNALDPLGFKFSPDNGQTWNLGTPWFNAGIGYTIGEFCVLNDTLFWANGGLLFSTDNGATWQNSNINAGTNHIKSQGQVLWAWCDDQSDYWGLYRSTDAGQTWNNLRGEEINELFIIQDTVLIHMKNQGFSRDSLLYSTNGGNTWTPIPYPFIYPDVYSVAVHGSRIYIAAFSYPNFMYWYTDNYGQNWHQIPVPVELTIHIEDGMMKLLAPQEDLLIIKSSQGNPKIWAYRLGAGLSLLNHDQFGQAYGCYDIVANEEYLYAYFWNATGLYRATLDSIQYAPIQWGYNSGWVYWDNNLNGVLDGGDSPAVLKSVLDAANSLTELTDSSGYFAFAYLDTANLAYGIHIGPQYPYVTAIPNQYNFNGFQDSLLFLLQMTPNVADLEVHLHNVIARPGFAHTRFITGSNPGTIDQIATITYTADSTVTILSAFPPPLTQVGNTLTWEIQLSVHENFTITVGEELDQNVPLGLLMQNSATIHPIVGDFTPLNNEDILDEMTLGAYDPNDKAVRPSPFTPAMAVARDSLTYTIRFQNVGNYYAENVRILDTLDSDLDPATFRLLGSSFPCRVEMHGQGILEFFFDNIFLPDSGLSEPSSHGFVDYSVKPRPGLVLGDTIRNTAYIFFDFNVPVVTNTATSRVETLVAVRQPASPVDLRIFPNPTKDVFEVELPEGISVLPLRFTLFDPMGRPVMSRELEGGVPLRVDASKLSPGVYRCRLSAKDGSQWEGSVVIVK